jgi:hypothetical protein
MRCFQKLRYWLFGGFLLSALGALGLRFPSVRRCVRALLSAPWAQRRDVLVCVLMAVAFACSCSACRA